MGKSTYLENALLSAVLRNTAFTSPSTVYVALFNGDPASGGTEVSGGGYARQSAAFSAPSSGVTANTAPINFTNMPAATITHVAIYDSLSGGNRLYSQAAAASKNTNSGDTTAIATGGLTISES